MTRDLPLTSVPSPSIIGFGPRIRGIWFRPTLAHNRRRPHVEERNSTFRVPTGGTGTSSLHRSWKGRPQLFAATNYGLFRSENDGETMIQVSSGEYMELAFHPTDPSICYTIQLLGESTVFKRSTDGGVSFATGASGWPGVGIDDGQRRCELAVTPADPDRVVVLAAGSTPDGGGLYGMYQSYDAGETFEFMCCGDGPSGPWEAGTNPNILGWSEDGSGDGGQYYYDLALDVSPTDADQQFAAGICVWRSENGGSDWSLNGHWVTWAGEFTADRYTHADVHDIQFFTHRWHGGHVGGLRRRPLLLGR